MYCKVRVVCRVLVLLFIAREPIRLLYCLALHRCNVPRLATSWGTSRAKSCPVRDKTRERLWVICCIKIEIIHSLSRWFFPVQTDTPCPSYRLDGVDRSGGVRNAQDPFGPSFPHCQPALSPAKSNQTYANVMSRDEENVKCYRVPLSNLNPESRDFTGTTDAGLGVITTLLDVTVMLEKCTRSLPKFILPQINGFLCTAGCTGRIFRHSRCILYIVEDKL